MKQNCFFVEFPRGNTLWDDTIMVLGIVLGFTAQQSNFPLTMVVHIVYVYFSLNILCTG